MQALSAATIGRGPKQTNQHAQTTTPKQLGNHCEAAQDTREGSGPSPSNGSRSFLKNSSAPGKPSKFLRGSARQSRSSGPASLLIDMGSLCFALSSQMSPHASHANNSPQRSSWRRVATASSPAHAARLPSPCQGTPRVCMRRARRLEIPIALVEGNVPAFHWDNALAARSAAIARAIAASGRRRQRRWQRRWLRWGFSDDDRVYVDSGCLVPFPRCA